MFPFFHDNVLLSDADLGRFLSALSNGEVKHVVDEKHGEYLQFPEGVYVYGTKARGSRLLIRPEYKALLQPLLAPPTRRGRFILRGPSGLGKSYFLIYVMWHVLANQQKGNEHEQEQKDEQKRPRTVFFYYGRENMMFRVAPGCAPEACVREAVRYLSDWDDVFLYDPSEENDGGPPCEAVRALILAAASPNNGLVNYTKGALPRKLWLYPWSDEELEDCRRICYPSLSEEELKTRSELAGGNARACFQVCSTEELREDLDTAVWRIDPNQLIRSGGDIEGAEQGLKAAAGSGKLSFGIFHYRRPEPVKDARYCHGPMVFASHEIEVMFADYLEQRGKTEVVRVLRDLALEPWAGGVRGVLFERYLHYLRSWGSRRAVDVLPLPRSDERKYSPLRLPPIPITDFKKGELKEKAARSPPLYLRPPRDFKAIDAISILPEGRRYHGKSVLLLQDTVADRHDVLASGVLDVFDALSEARGITPADCLLVFYVPDDKVTENKWKNKQRYPGYAERTPEEKAKLDQLQQAVAVVPLDWMREDPNAEKAGAKRKQPEPESADAEGEQPRSANKCLCRCTTGNCRNCVCFKSRKSCDNCWSANCTNNGAAAAGARAAND